MKTQIAYIVLLFSLIFSFSGKVFCQTVDLLRTGIIKGVVYDSTSNTPLTAATVAVYNVKDTALVSYTLSAKGGGFTFQRMPISKDLKIIISYIGYKTFEKNTRVTRSNNLLDLGRINLPISSKKQDDVVINAIPPVQMNGDTLEFNADAFKMDPNAQTEDLLRILPGITIWSDGVITVNGREVHSLLVNGKPFFSSDIRVATRNIPKNVVEKVQVYVAKKDTVHTLKDSTTEINIQLKKGKDKGYFGKLSSGYGTAKAYDMDATINFFNRNTQLSIGATHNTINKMAGDMSQLLVNSTFKSNGTSMDYQSDFSLPGHNNFSAAGLFLQHDFIPKSDSDNTDRLTSMYFFNDTKQTVNSTSQTITSLGNDRSILQQNTVENKNSHLAQRGSGQYEKKWKGSNFNIRGDFNRGDVEEYQMETISLKDENFNPLSTNTTSNNTTGTTNGFDIAASLKHSPVNSKKSHLLSNYDVSYRLAGMDTHQNRDYRSEYLTLTDTPEQQELYRIYNSKFSKQQHNLTTGLPNITPFIVKNGFLSTVRIGLKNELKIRTYHESDVVKDRDSLSNTYLQNTYLTNSRHETEVDLKPALIFNKTLAKSKSTSFSRELSTDISIGPDFYTLNSFSQNSAQKFSKKYKKLLSSIQLTFNNTRFGRFYNYLDLELSTSYQYPTVDQLAPLLDNANPNFIQIGNFALKEQSTHTLLFKLIHNSLKSKNTFNYNLFMHVESIDNYFTNSNTIDTLGRTVSQPVNANGYKSGILSGEIKKNYKMKNSQFQFTLSPSLSVGKSPIQLNDSLNYYYNISYFYKPTITYEYKDVAVTTFSINFSNNRYKETGSANSWTVNKALQSKVTFLLNCTKKLSLSSNATYTENTFNKTDHTKFTIWNANMAYRLYEDNRAEIKLSAFDILHQNTGLNNSSTANSLTQGETTTLQQYFMVTLAWYPRKFGKF